MKTTTTRRKTDGNVIRIAGSALPARRGVRVPPTRRHADRRRQARVNQRVAEDVSR